LLLANPHQRVLVLVSGGSHQTRELVLEEGEGCYEERVINHSSNSGGTSPFKNLPEIQQAMLMQKAAPMSTRNQRGPH
jgi:hypothetical protein